MSNFGGVNWSDEQLIELSDAKISKYLQNYEKKAFGQQQSTPEVSVFAQLFSNESNPEDFEDVWSKQGVKLSVRDYGTSIDNDLPCVKAEFTFDPAFSLQEVFDAMQNETMRRRWDPTIKTSKVLKTS